LNTALYTTPAVFDDLAFVWDTLLDTDHSIDFFMSVLWQKTWWKHLGRGTLNVITVRDDFGSVVGIAPWFIEQTGDQRVVRTVGCEAVSDYLNVISHKGAEEQVFSAVFEFMLSSDAPAWDSFNLCNIHEDASIIARFPDFARQFNLVAEIIEEDVSPFVMLPDTYDEYLDRLDKKQRHELRRKRRRAEENNVTFTAIDTADDIEAGIQEFLALMAMSTPQKASFLEEPGHTEFFQEIGQGMLAEGCLILLFASFAGEPAATMWQFHFRDRMMLYNSGLNPSAFSALSPGIVLLTYSIEDAISRGCHYYDFLQGDEQYKFRMGAQAAKVYNMMIRRPDGN
jgi:CelD/BcsL family acetyltransferase involved in cellulose biosynthesis